VTDRFSQRARDTPEYEENVHVGAVTANTQGVLEILGVEVHLIGDCPTRIRVENINGSKAVAGVEIVD
jgi:hypothetical protein